MGAADAWILAAVPAAAFLFIAIAGKGLPRQGDYLGVLAIGTSFVMFFFVLADFLDGGSLPVVHDMAWTEIGEFELRMGIFVDQITIVMLGVVTFVSLMVNIFSIGYMKGEARYYWYFAVLQIFAASMIMLVMADNLLLLYMAWELVGTSSFLLIGFFWEKRSATEAAKKAFITTRIGDVGLLIGILLLWDATGTFNIQEIIHAVEAGEIGDTRLFVTMMFVFLGAMGKSAQFPFHVWLPDAMEGPTPVSALIHAATMVVAGVYLVARLLPIFEVADGMTLIITMVGLTTALMSGFIAITQTDIKKVLAYSTIGQLGFMFVALGAGEVSAAMFHLTTHAFFKALLFLAAGSVILGTHHNQEMNKLGGLWRKMPITATTFAIGSLALAGAFPLAGFWSKDEILHATQTWSGGWVTILLGFAAVLTAFYTTRLFIRTFLGRPRDEHVYENARETGLTMTVPLILLAILAAVSGLLVFNNVGEALGFPGGFPEFVYGHEPHRFAIDWGLAAASTGIFAAGTLFGFWMYWRGSLARATAVAEWQPGLYRLLDRKFFMDDLYQVAVDRVVLGFSYVVSWFDRYVVNDTGVDGSAQMTGYSGYLLKFIQTGRVPNYAMGIALGVLVLAGVALAAGG